MAEQHLTGATCPEWIEETTEMMIVDKYMMQSGRKREVEQLRSSGESQI